jgi:hypothetical protein
MFGSKKRLGWVIDRKASSDFPVKITNLKSWISMFFSLSRGFGFYLSAIASSSPLLLVATIIGSMSSFGPLRILCANHLYPFLACINPHG